MKHFLHAILAAKDRQTYWAYLGELKNLSQGAYMALKQSPGPTIPAKSCQVETAKDATHVVDPAVAVITMAD